MLDFYNEDHAVRIALKEKDNDIFLYFKNYVYLCIVFRDKIFVGKKLSASSLNKNRQIN